MQPDLRTICDDLVQLGTSEATPSARKKIEDAISSKWDGAKVAAAKALAQWGDPESVQRLKELLVAIAAKPSRSTAVWGIVKLLRPYLRPTDLDWVCDVYVHNSHESNGTGLVSLFEVFSPEEILMRLEAEAHRSGKATYNMECAIIRAQYRYGIEWIAENS